MIIDHIGIGVRSIERAARQWEEAFGYRRMTEVVTNTRQKVRVQFLGRSGSLPVKLFEPADASSPVQTFARRGGGLHHLCFKCDALGPELQRLAAVGLRVIAPPQPGEAFENEPIAFLYAGDGLNVEVIDTDKRAGRLPG